VEIDSQSTLPPNGISYHPFKQIKNFFPSPITSHSVRLYLLILSWSPHLWVHLDFFAFSFSSCWASLTLAFLRSPSRPLCIKTKKRWRPKLNESTLSVSLFLSSLSPLSILSLSLPLATIFFSSLYFISRRAVPFESKQEYTSRKGKDNTFPLSFSISPSFSLSFFLSNTHTHTHIIYLSNQQLLVFFLSQVESDIL
jgi:hypothetical protein